MMKQAEVAAILLACLTFSGRIEARIKRFEILTPEVRQGGVAVVKIEQNFLDGNAGIYFLGRVYHPNKEGLVFLPIDCYSKPGENYQVFLVNIDTGLGSDLYHEEINVLEGNFIEKPWPFKSPAKLTIQQSKKRQKERKIIRLALDWVLVDRSEDLVEGKFIEPLNKMEVIEGFGVKRVSRGQIVEVHGGVDLRTNDPNDRHDKKPKQVMAINSGRVILARKFSSEGNLVVIYHGNAVFSLYMHLSRLNVKNGQKVKRGQVVALSGNTGHVTGPHLDFRVSIDGTKIDPLSFIETANKYLGDGQ